MRDLPCPGFVMLLLVERFGLWGNGNSTSTQHKAEGVSLSSPPHGAGEGSWGRAAGSPGWL